MVRILHRNHCAVSVSLGITTKTMHTLHAVVDPASGYNVIRKEALSLGWLGRVMHDAPLTNRADANGNPLPVKHVIQLRMRLGETS